jgi:arabinose-5-phosphate isomerase
MAVDQKKLLKTAQRVIRLEAQALDEQVSLIGDGFVRACELILECRGRIIVTGMGKSGHIAQKIAASLTSTGTAAHFLHPAEGVHGDLGVVHRDDLLLALSLSGETQEILGLLPPIKHLGVPVVAITGSLGSTLARDAEAVLQLAPAPEADPHDLVPTTSSTLSLAVGDALVVALMEAREFTPEDFAVFHPQGMLGKRLTLHVSGLLGESETNPVVCTSDTFGVALEVITLHKLGGTSVVCDQGKLTGIITDGDIRRIISRFIVRGGTVAEAIQTSVAELMTKDPSYVGSDALAYDALKMMENHQPRPIFLLPVVDKLKRPVGMIHLHDLVQAGFKSAVATEGNARS